VRTFARCPHVTEPGGVDAAIVGAPFDTATSFRPGARFGPEAIRAASMLLRPYNPEFAVDVFPGLSVVDWGDLELTPGNAERTTDQVGDGLGSLLAADVVPILLGGDHSVTLGALRAQAAKYGPVAVVLLDAHADTWDQYYGERYFHGTVFRRAVEEGVVAPERSLLAGIRGSLYSEDDLTSTRELGFELISGTELGRMTAEDYGRRVRERIGDGPAYFSFDIDVVDPAFAPGTGTPEVGGLTGREVLAFIRSLAGVRFGGFDVVEVAPPYDGPGQTTALLAANVAYEFLSLTALAR
jgi:agmatinase